MSTWLYANETKVGMHDIVATETAADIARRSRAMLEYCVDWPHMWRVNDRVTVELADGVACDGVVLAVSEETGKVLIILGESMDTVPCWLVASSYDDHRAPDPRYPRR